MPRKPRISVPGALHHIMARGIEGRTIFRCDEDRMRFLSLLSSGIAKSGFKCYAWVLMENHYHLLLRANESPLSSLMRPLNSKYAHWFRKKSQTRGYLFQDRFKSLVTQDQGYIEQLVRYIHLNPVRAGICRTIAELDRYPWSGHSILTGRQKCGFQDTAAVLNRFGTDHKSAVLAYCKFIQDGIDTEDKPDFMDFVRMSNKETADRHEHRCWVMGDSGFVKAALEHDRARRLQVASFAKNNWTVQRVAEAVARQMDIDTREIFKRGRGNGRSMLRKVVAAFSHRTFDIPIGEIGRYYGIGGSSISRMLDEGEEYARRNKIMIKH